MVQPADANAVAGDFAAGDIDLRGEEYKVEEKDGKYYITESFFTGDSTKHRIDFTLGNRRIQHYLTRLDTGYIVVLPPTWDVLRQEWFHNMEIVAPEESQVEVPVQVWNRNCFGCHVSGEDKNYHIEGDSYTTEWAEFGATCDRCHGPSGLHVARYSKSGAELDIDRNYIVLQTELHHRTNSEVWPYGPIVHCFSVGRAQSC